MQVGGKFPHTTSNLPAFPPKKIPSFHSKLVGMEKSGKKAVAKKKGRQQHGEHVSAPQPLVGPNTLVGIAKRISGGVVGALSGSAADQQQTAGDEARPDEMHGQGTSLEQKQQVLHSHRLDAERYQQLGSAPQFDGTHVEAGRKAAQREESVEGRLAAGILNGQPCTLMVALAVMLGLLAFILVSGLKQAATTPLQPFVSQLLELNEQVSRISKDELPALRTSLSDDHNPLHERRLDDLGLKLEDLEGSMHALSNELHAQSANATPPEHTCSHSLTSSSLATACPVCGGHHHFLGMGNGNGTPCPVTIALMHASKLDSIEAALATLSGPLVPMLLHSHSPTAATHPGQGNRWSVCVARLVYAFLHRIFQPGQPVRHPRARQITGPLATSLHVHPAVNSHGVNTGCPLWLEAQGAAVELQLLLGRALKDLVAISFVVTSGSHGASGSNRHADAGNWTRMGLEVYLGLDATSDSCRGNMTGTSWVPSGAFKVNLGSFGAGGYNNSFVSEGHNDGYVSAEEQPPDATTAAKRKLASSWLAGRGLRAYTFGLPGIDSDGVQGCLASGVVTRVRVEAKTEPQQHNQPLCMPYVYVHA